MFLAVFPALPPATSPQAPASLSQGTLHALHSLEPSMVTTCPRGAGTVRDDSVIYQTGSAQVLANENGLLPINTREDSLTHAVRYPEETWQAARVSAFWGSV